MVRTRERQLPKLNVEGSNPFGRSRTLKFVYNYKNLICEVKQQNDALVATYAYDALGRRVEKWVNSGSVTERYVYSGVETVCVYDGSDALNQEFAFDVTGIDAVLMLQQKDVLDYDGDSNTTEVTRSYYHRNGLGSVVEISDASQAEAVSYRYTPYGELQITRGGVMQSVDPIGQPIAFTARVRDAETSLSYFRARVQDPMIGRFLQRDPLGYMVGSSLYEHVGSRPTLLRDPHGLDGEGAPLPEGDSGHTLPNFADSVREEASEMLDVIDGLSDNGLTDLLNYATFAAIADYAMDLPSKYEGDGYSASTDSDQGDALRHCMWQCELSKAFGADVAEKIGDIHEKWGMRRAAAQKQEKGRDGRTPVEREQIRSDMDDMNNFLGRECAGQPSCMDCCLRKLSVGRLISAVGGDLGTTGPGHLCNPKRKPRKLPWPLDRWWFGGPPIIAGWML